MATTASIIPLVGYNQIEAFVNNEALPVPIADDQTEGRKGTMRVAFRLLQSDTQNVNDLQFGIVIKRPLAVGALDDEGDAVDMSVYSPVAIISQSGNANPADTHPRIRVFEASETQVEEDTLRVDLYFDASAAPGNAQYDVLIDFSHSIAS